MLTLDQLEHHYFTGQHANASTLFEEFVEEAPHYGPHAILELVRRLNHPHHGFAVCLALAGGELMARGQPASLLGRALVAPLMRALVDARRLLEHVSHLPDTTEEELARGEDASGRKRVRVGLKLVDPSYLERVAEHDVAALQAWEALDVWHVPIVATWTRDVSILRDMQQSAPLRKLVDDLGQMTATSQTLSVLLDTLFGARFVVLLPELEHAYAFVADGVVTMGQLCALMTPHLRAPLAELGITRMPDADVVDAMRGHGPQCLDAWYRCAFHCYPVDVHHPHGETAARGKISHGSLPPNFLPARLPLIDGSRVLLLTGPNASTDRFERYIPAARMFAPLHAEVSKVTRLSADTAKRWFDLVKGRATYRN